MTEYLQNLLKSSTKVKHKMQVSKTTQFYVISSQNKHMCNLIIYSCDFSAVRLIEYSMEAVYKYTVDEF